MVCAGLVVGWLLLFTRTLAAAERTDSATAVPESRWRGEPPVSPGAR
jgi:hypothetical protein